MSERVNPKYIEALRADRSVGTPLFDAVRKEPVPPETKASSETQRSSWSDIDGSAMQQQMREKVYRCIKDFGPIASWQIAQKTRLERYVVTARICELHDLGLIYEAGKIKNPSTNKLNTVYRTTV
jgi:hypothetical protein